jgi:hypothetical protein
VNALSDEAIDTLIDLFPSVPSPFSLTGLWHLGGAVSRVGEQDTAFSHRQARYCFDVFGTWAESAESAKNVGWTRRVWDAMQPFLEDGGYVNYLSEGEGEARVRAVYGVNYERLAAIKRKYDPTNFFRLNQNIEI